VTKWNVVPPSISTGSRAWCVRMKTGTVASREKRLVVAGSESSYVAATKLHVPPAAPLTQVRLEAIGVRVVDALRVDDRLAHVPIDARHHSEPFVRALRCLPFGDDRPAEAKLDVAATASDQHDDSLTADAVDPNVRDVDLAANPVGDISSPVKHDL
jgi:hypothetical protein